MAPGAGRRSTRRRGSKPHAHKRRRGGGGGGGADVRANNDNSARTNNGGGDNHRGDTLNVRASWKSRRRNRSRARSGRNTTVGNNSKTYTARRKGAPNSGLQPIRVSSSGIMSTWKKPLGGLIRYYVHTRMHDKESPVDQGVAEDEIDRMYYRSGCSMDDTKAMILESLGVKTDDWIGVSMAIEKDGQMDNVPMDISNVEGGAPAGYNKTVDGKGIILKQVLRAGEGPAHSNEQWTTIVVPEWAVGKSYYFQVKNNSSINLSCELFLDGEKVAFNAPLNAHGTRTIRPDVIRYYQRHQWILNDAKRVKLARNVTSNNDSQRQHTPTAPRYNGVRPDYAGQRINLEQYPDPIVFGWQFTGSVEASRVEFFEKKMNNGGKVILDFYYTTGTIKTVLHHPTSGRNQLFRAQVSPEQYAAIMKNPRAHTGQGYRRIENRPPGNNSNSRENEEDDEFDRVPSVQNQTENEMEMEGNNGIEASVPATYYAKDDNYDFKRQGHQNRRDEMSRLQQSGDYTEWKEANKKEYAMIHAKFYVSMPKRMYRAPQQTQVGFKQRKGKHMEPLPVPEQSTVVDIKAAENVILGTKYELCPPQNIGRSPVRMERINGLTDDKAWKGEPVFEKKLYYRAENIINGQGFGEDSDGMSEDENEEAFQNPSLTEYKTEKIDQTKQYYAELNMHTADEEETEQRLRNVKNKIHLSESIKDVDDVVNLFHSDLIHRQIVDNNSIP